MDSEIRGVTELLSIDCKIVFTELDFEALQRKGYKHPGSPSNACQDTLVKTLPIEEGELSPAEIWFHQKWSGGYDCHISAETFAQAIRALDVLRLDVGHQ